MAAASACSPPTTRPGSPSRCSTSTCSSPQVALLAQGLIEQLAAANGSDRQRHLHRRLPRASLRRRRLRRVQGRLLATPTRWRWPPKFAPTAARQGNADLPGEIDTKMLSPGTAAFADREVHRCAGSAGRRRSRPRSISCAIDASQLRERRRSCTSMAASTCDLRLRHRRRRIGRIGARQPAVRAQCQPGAAVARPASDTPHRPRARGNPG